MFYSDPRPAFKRKKRSNWVSPKTLGFFFILLSLLCMMMFAMDEEGVNSSPFLRFLYTPAAILHGGKNYVQNTFHDFMENFHAKKELDALQEEMKQMRLELVELRYKLRNYEAYRKALLFTPEEEFPAIVAIVVGYQERMNRSLVINRGKKHGVSVNMPVYTDKGLIGRTILLSEHFSKVQPITDAGSAVGVFVEGTPYKGILRGTEDNDTMLLTDLHLDFTGDVVRKPQAGMAVFTLGKGPVFPMKMLAGYVTDATTEEDEVVVEPAVDIESVDSVLVMTSTRLKKEMLSLLSEEE